MTSSNQLHEALALLQQGAFSSARALCRQVLAQQPANFNARHLLGVINLKAGNAISACRELQRASELPVAPRFRAQALSNLALALQQRGKADAALDALDEATRLAPQEIAFQLNLLGQLEQLGRWTTMLEHAETAPALAQAPEAQLLLARAERQLQRFDAGWQRLQPLIDGCTDHELLGEWALLGLHSQRPGTLAEQCQRWSTALLQAVADYLAEEGEQQGALQLYRLLLAREPDNASVRHLLDAAAGTLAAAAPADYVRALYDAHAGEFEQHLVDRLGYRAPTLLVSELQQQLPKTLGRVADLGCGSGLLGKALRAQFEIASLSGCDLSGGMLREARRSGCYDSLEQQELGLWLAQQQPLQLICATDVLIYTGDLAPILASAGRALCASGWFAFTVEQGEEHTPLQLHRSGRYRHSAAHIRQAALANGFEVRLCAPFPLREEEGKMIQGLMVLLQRTTAQPPGVAP